MMRARDSEVFEVIRRDDLAYLITTRHEKPLDGLCPDDTPPILRGAPSAPMVAAFCGAMKCFHFLMRSCSRDYVDADVFFAFYGVPFFLIGIASTLRLLAGISKFLTT